MLFVGFLSALAFAFINTPLIYNVWKTKRAEAITWPYIVMNYIGNICAFIYVLDTNLKTGEFQVPLFLNYSFATICVIILTRLKIKYKGTKIAGLEIQQ